MPNNQDLVDKGKHETFLFLCPACIPFCFASHPWFVSNQKGVLTRWEILHTPNKDKNMGHLHTNHFPPFQGIGMWPFPSQHHWKSKCLWKAEGPLAEKINNFLSKSLQTYPFINQYSLTGPNSNTYVQWVLNHFPEFNTKLPWNAIGKTFTI